MTTYGFEGANGATATAAGLGVTTVSAGAGNTITTDTTTGVVAGTSSLHFRVGSTVNVSLIECPTESGGPLTVSVYIALTLDSEGYNTSGGTTTLVQFYNSDASQTIGRLGVTNAGALTFTDQGTAHTLTINANITAYYGTTVAIRLQMNTGTTTSNGAVTARFYADPFAAVGTYIGTEAAATNHSLGAGLGFGKSRIGLISAQATTGTDGFRDLWADNYVIQSGLSWITPPAAASAPTANAGTSQDVVAGSTITLSASGSTGTITGYSWTCTSFPVGASSPSIATPTAATTTTTLTAGGRYVFQVVVSGSGGTTSTATVTEYVYEASNVDVAMFAVGSTTYTNEGGASSLLAAVNDSNVLTYAQSPANPTGQTLPLTANPVGPGACSAFVEGNWTGGLVNRTVTVKKPDGTTLVSVTYPLTSVETDHEVPITGASSLTQTERRGLQVIISDAV